MGAQVRPMGVFRQIQRVFKPRQARFLVPHALPQKSQLQCSSVWRQRREDLSGEHVKASAMVPLVALLPPELHPGSLADVDALRVVMESLVSMNGVAFGLPGVVSMGIFLVPMFEVVPRLRREKTVGMLPMLPYSAMATQGMVWSLYGHLVSNPAVMSPNLCALGLGLFYCREYLRFCPAGADWLPWRWHHHVGGMAFLFLHCCGAVLTLSPEMAVTVLGLTGNMLTLLMFGGPLAAARTVIREKSTRSLPFGFMCAVNLNCNLWFFYAYFIMNDPFIYFQDGLGLLLTAVQFALFVRYGVHSWKL